jgi:hypothetical protein
MEYDFAQLNDKEFEILVCDLLSEELGIRFERFKSGKDAGVDARFFGDNRREVVVQCKHYLKSGVAALARNLEKTEKPKIDALKPSRYIIATSCPLSRKNKEQIFQTLAPHLKTPSDIFGSEDLNDLLRRHGEVEKRHSKLWMVSAALLTWFLNRAIEGRSQALLERATSKSRLFARCKGFDEALERLQKAGVVIITGEPGVGKTTLAEHLCLHYFAQDFEIYEVVNDLSQAESVYEIGKKQLFYFDDFLGSNYLHALEYKEDAHITRFIERITKDKTKKFVLTSRTNILVQGIAQSDRLRMARVKRNEYLLKVDQLTRLERAQILYNHLWHSDLNSEHIEALYEDERYLDVVKHTNFNPRIIEFITDSQREGFPGADEYWNYVVQNLTNPKEIWRNNFKVQSDEHVRSLVKMTVMSGGKISESALAKGFDFLREDLDRQTADTVERDFRWCLELAVGSFLNRAVTDEGKLEISLFNPSITDFFIGEYGGNPKELTRICLALEDSRSLRTLSELRKEDILSESAYDSVLEELQADPSFQAKSIDYQIALGDKLRAVGKGEGLRIHLVRRLGQEPEEVGPLGLLFSWLRDATVRSAVEGIGFLQDCIGGQSLSNEEAIELGALLCEEEDKNEELFDVLAHAAINLVEEDLEQWISDQDLSEYVDREDFDYGDGDYGMNLELREHELKDGMHEAFNRYLDDFDERVSEAIYSDIRSFIEEYDFDNLLDGYRDSLRYQDDDRESFGGSRPADTDDTIRDLFHRG